MQENEVYSLFVILAFNTTQLLRCFDDCTFMTDNQLVLLHGQYHSLWHLACCTADIACDLTQVSRNTVDSVLVCEEHITGGTGHATLLREDVDRTDLKLVWPYTVERVRNNRAPNTHNLPAIFSPHIQRGCST